MRVALVHPGSRSSGFTLVELVVALVVLGIGTSAFLVLINQATRDSVDPLIHNQANAVAQSYLEEILLQSFCLPPPASVPARPNRDAVCQYDGTAEPATDRNGAAIAGLADYFVTVDVLADGGALGLPADAAVRVDVSVAHPVLSGNIVLSGYKVDL